MHFQMGLAQISSKDLNFSGIFMAVRLIPAIHYGTVIQH